MISSSASFRGCRLRNELSPPPNFSYITLRKFSFWFVSLGADLAKTFGLSFSMLFELHRWHVHQCIVRPVVVVLELELFGLAPDLLYGIEQKAVQWIIMNKIKFSKASEEWDPRAVQPTEPRLNSRITQGAPQSFITACCAFCAWKNSPHDSPTILPTTAASRRGRWCVAVNTGWIRERGRWWGDAKCCGTWR